MTGPEHCERGVEPPDWHINYLSGELNHFRPIEVDGTTPQEARDFLSKNGYTDDMWDYILQNKSHSHEIRSSIIIARGDIPRLYYLIRQRMRYEEGSIALLGRFRDGDFSLLFTPRELSSGDYKR